ncbi:AAA family ATPase [Bradyrhizobium sp. BRP20]|uniref:AAA family ATPase n=1 Tax=unclassified Bradyrhizobium TaxID=2631580 RepID=UPI001CD7E81B|nr:AAA family ATPase [Bradyrhizobium sp. BRP20]MCA1552144.1 AAA family ATPase [Bradyrhizobium sp. BRP19]
MRIRSLDLIRYGHFTGTTLHFPSGEPDFHIVYGENEAGKSTTMSAIEDLLFGIPGQSSRNFLHENAALRIGAALERDGALLSVRRRKGNKDTLLGPDDLPIAAGDGLLAPLLGGMDRAFFCRMFCLDHERLRAGGRDITQAKDDIGAALFAAGAGVSGLRDRLGAMQAEADGLWASRKAGHRKYYQAEDRLKEADAALRQHTVSASKWQELKSAFEEARGLCNQIEKEIEEQVSELAKISRVRRVYRGVRRLQEIETEIVDLGAVVELPPDAARQFEEASGDNAAAEVRISAFREQIATIGAEISGLVVDDSVLLHQTEIERLSKRSIQLSSARTDLPKRRAELAAAEEGLKRAAIELGWTGPVADLVERIPPRAKVAAVRGLLTSRGSRFAAVDSAEAALEDANEKLADIQARIEALGAQKDLSALAGVVESIRAFGDLDARLLSIHQEHQDADRSCQRQMADMNPPIVSETSLQALKSPAEEAVRVHRDAARELQARIQRQQAVTRELTRTVENNRKSYARLVSDERIVAVEELKKLRERRDAGWSIIRRRHVDKIMVPESEELAFTSGEPLLDAYVKAIEDADTAADRRFQNAQSTAAAMVLARQIAEEQDVLESAKQELFSLAEEQKALAEAWAILWKQVTDNPRSPDEMLDWLDARAGVLDQIAKRDAALHAESSLQQQIAKAKQQLASLMADTAIAASADSLPLNGILAAAEARLRMEEGNTQKRNELALEQRKVATEVERRRVAVENAAKERDVWNAQWKEALRGINLLPEAPLETVQEQIEAIDQMRETSAKIADLKHERIGKIERDITAFTEDVEKLVNAIAPRFSGQNADEAILQLHAQLNAAMQTVVSRDEKAEAMQGLQKKLEECDKSRTDAEAVIDRLKRAAAVDSIDRLRAAILQSDLQRALRDERSRLRTTLEADGDGLGVEQLAEECRSADLDQTTAREQTLKAILNDARERQLIAIQSRNDAERLFEAVGGDAAAAKAAGDRQLALAEMKEVAAQYARVRSATIILRWAIERFRREKQAPLLKRAGELFSILTGGSFQRLTLEYDEKDVPHLAGVRGDGGAVPVSGLSEGAADQLFFALRIAAVEEYLMHAAPVPFIADDLFINYDDARASAGFRVLQLLAEKTQVLFFTHHQHLLDVASTAFDRSVSTAMLEPRPHQMKNVA